MYLLKKLKTFYWMLMVIKKHNQYKHVHTEQTEK